MDRQAWVAVTLCGVGLVFYMVYTAQHPPVRIAQPLPTPSPMASAAEFSPTPTSSPNESNAVAASAPPAPSAFGEKTETIRNSDVELRLTNRGGGISEVR